MKNILTILLFVIFIITFYIYPQTRIKNKIYISAYNSAVQNSKHAKMAIRKGLSKNNIQDFTSINKTTGKGNLKSTTIWQDWDDSVWINNSKDSLVYNGNNMVKEDLLQGWDRQHSNWSNSRLITNTYNGINQTSLIWQEWNGTNWTNIWSDTYTYDINNNIINDTVYTWRGSWVVYQLTTNYYDDNNKRTANLSQDRLDTSWVNVTLVSYTYDSNRNMTQYVNQEWDGLKWINYSKDSRVYNIDNNLISESFQLWKDSVWVNYFRYKNTFNQAHQKTINLYQTWDGQKWINSERWLYNYKVNNNTEQIHQKWNGYYWVNNYMYSLTYDENNNITESLQLSWYNSQWVLQGRILIRYIPVTGVKDKKVTPKEFVLNQNYPNPFNPNTIISYSLPSDSKVIIKIYNLLGQEIKTLVNKMETAGDHQIKFNAENLSSGIYLYRIQTDNFTRTKKMILLK